MLTPARSIIGTPPSSRNWIYRRLDLCRASFETPAARAPQDEVFFNAIKEVPHAEEHRGEAAARLEARWASMQP